MKSVRRSVVGRTRAGVSCVVVGAALLVLGIPTGASAEQVSSADRTAVAAVPAVVAQTAQAVTVTPNTNLTDKQKISVRATGFNPGDTVTISQCVGTVQVKKPADGGNIQQSCSESTVKFKVAGADGTVTDDAFEVKLGASTLGGSTCKAGDTCVIAAVTLDIARLASAQIKFAPAGGTATTAATTATTAASTATTARSTATTAAAAAAGAGATATTATTADPSLASTGADTTWQVLLGALLLAVGTTTLGASRQAQVRPRR